MNIGFWSCIILVIPFLIIGVLFAIFKEKAAKFVSGFNSFSKEEQALYDKAHISRDIRNQCFIWAVIMLAGALLSCFLTPYMAIPTYIIWLVLFFREVHFDNHKAFKKYLLKFASMIGMPLDDDLLNSSEISIINKAVDYLEAKRTINKGMEDIVLKREKNKENI